MVTDTGSLVVYNAATAARPWFRVNAHDGEATTVDWHPTKRYVIATGGAQDRTVKGEQPNKRKTRRRSLRSQNTHFQFGTWKETCLKVKKGR